MWNRQKQKARALLDSRLEQLKPISQYERPASGWVKAIREALGMSAAQLAGRLGVSRQRIHDLEKAELHGGITLTSLRAAAEALDCTLVYALVPTSSLTAMVEKKARRVAQKDLAYIDQTMALEDQALPDEGFEEQITEYIDASMTEKDLWKGS